MGKFREWELWTDYYGKRHIGGADIIEDDGNPVRVIEYKAFTEAVKLIDELSDVVEIYVKAKSNNLIVPKGLATEALAKIKEFKEKGE